MASDRCEDCRAPKTRVSLDGAALCDRCFDRRVAKLTGYPELPDPPDPIVITGPDGQPHELAVRLWRAPTGIEVELEETGVPVGQGFHFAVLGSHRADVAELLERVRRRAQDEIGRQYLEESPHRPGWQLRDDEIAGRLVWGEEHNSGGPYDAVVDGRTLTWDELGRALESYEGWTSRLVLEDRCLEDLRPDAEVIALSAPTRVVGDQEEVLPLHGTPSPTIDHVLAEFLAEQEKRLAPRTFRNYAGIVALLRDCLNGYGHQSLNQRERKHWESAFTDDEDAFVKLFGPDKISEDLGEFLGYFMIRKVMAGEELLRAAGTVTKKLAKWLGEHGYLDAGTVDIAAERAKDAARDLPRAERLARLLYEQASKTAIDVEALEDDDYIDDYLTIDRVETGKLWFEGGIGPVKVPKAASDITQAGWAVNVVLGRAGRAWHILEVGNVYP